MSLCVVDGCEGRKKARGFCSKHYAEWRHRHGQHRCTEEFCREPVHARGLCDHHYRQLPEIKATTYAYKRRYRAKYPFTNGKPPRPRPSEEWRNEAFCTPEKSGLSLEEIDWMFFPPRGHNEAAAAAKEVCARCPVRVECVEYAIETRQWWGIWGGTTPRQRQRIRRQRRQVA